MVSIGEIGAVTVALFVVFSASFYAFVKYMYSYWERRGIPYLTPTFPFGNYGKNFMQKISNADEMVEHYNKTTEPFVGTFAIFRPILFLRDPDLIRSIMIKDFQYFVNRGVYYDEKNDPLSAHLFAIDGDKWKNLRVKLSPTFTSGKLKSMFSTLTDCSVPLINYMNAAIERNEIIEIRDLTARYSTNVIASVAFGLDTDCIADPNTPFRKYGKKFFDANIKNGIRNFAMMNCPQLLKMLRMRLIDKDVEDFMIDIVDQTLKLREGKQIVRKDFFQLLVQLRNSGIVQLDDKWETIISNDDSKTCTIEELAAQAYVFLIAGFETSSATMSYLLYEISKSPEIQRKIQQEVDDVLKKHGGQMSYDAVNDMMYLECCINETLRKYPVAPLLARIATKAYKIPGTKTVIEKGTSVAIPVYALQNDEKYFQNPKKFDPSRFFEDNLRDKTFSNWPYFPFGEGPRNCIGLRLGKLQTKVGAAIMLQNFNFELTGPSAKRDIEFSAATFVLTPKEGIHLKASNR